MISSNDFLYLQSFASALLLKLLFMSLLYQVLFSLYSLATFGLFLLGLLFLWEAVSGRYEWSSTYLVSLLIRKWQKEYLSIL